MQKWLASMNQIVMVSAVIFLIAFVAALPFLQLRPPAQSGLIILLAFSIAYGLTVNSAVQKWGWLKIAPVVEPVNVAIVTVAFFVTYQDIPVIWIFYFIVIFSAALLTNARWTYINGALCALGYLGVVALHHDLANSFGLHLIVAGVLIASGIFGGSLSAVVRRQSELVAHTESRLHQSEERFRVMSDQTKDIIYRYRVGEPAGIEYVNAAAEQITGYNLADFRNNPNLFLENLHPQDRERVVSAFGGRNISRNLFTFRWQHKDGHWLWLEADTIPIFAADGITLVAVEGIVRDVTQTRHITSTLQEQIGALRETANAQSRLILQAKQRTEQLARLNEIGRAVSQLSDLDSVFKVIFEQLQAIMPLEVFFVGFLDAAHETISFPFLYDSGKLYQQPPIKLRPEDSINRTLTECQPILVNRTPEQMNINHEARVGNTSKHSASLMFAPLQIGNTLLGALSVQSYQFNAYTEEHLALLTGIAHQAAIAIENARLLEAERKRLVLAETLQKFGKLLTAEMSLPQVLDSILDLLAPVVEYTSTSLQLLDETGTLELVAGRGLPDLERARQIVREISAHSLSLNYADHQAIIIADTHHDPRWIIKSGYEYIHSWIGAPLIVKGKLIGVLSVDHARENAYDESMAQTALAFADQAALAIANARLLDAEHKQLVHAQTLHEISKLLTAEIKLDQLLEAILDLLKRVVQYDSVSIQLVDATGCLELVAGRGFPNMDEMRAFVRRFSPHAIERWRDQNSAIIIPDTHHDPRWAVTPESQYIRAWIGAPLIVKGKLIGILNVDSRQVNAFTAEQGDTVRAFADQAAIAIENARLYEAAEKRANQFAALYETTRDLTGTQDLTPLLHTIVDHAIQLLRGGGGGMYFYDENTQMLEVVVATQSLTPVGTRLKMGEGMAGRVAQTRQPLIVDDYRTWAGRSQQFAEDLITAVIEVPMLYRGELIGILVVEEIDDTTHKFTEEDARLLSLFAAQAAGAIHSARLFASEQQRSAELEALRQASLSLTSSLDLSAVLEKIAERVLRLLPDASNTHIYLYENERLTFGTSLHADGRKGEQFSEPRQNGLTYTVARDRTLKIFPDMQKDPLFQNTAPSWHGAIIGMPLQLGETVVGVMNIAYNRPREFNEAEVRALRLLGDQAAIAIGNARLHQTLQESEARYRSLVENLPIAVYRVTPGAQGEFLMANPAYLKMFGYGSFDELRQIHVSDLYPTPAGRREFSEMLVRQGRVDGYEQQLKRKDGSTIWALVTAQVVYQNDAPAYFDCTAIDITTRKLEALAREQAETSLQQRTGELEALLQVSRDISAHLELERVLTDIAEGARELLNVNEATIFLLDETKTHLRPIVALGDYREERLALRLRLGEGIVGWVAQQRQAVAINHTAQDHRIIHVPNTPDDDESILCAPLIHGEELQGVILLTRLPATGFSPHELEFLIGLAAQTSTAIANARLYEETRRHAEELLLINQISATINQPLDVQDILDTTLQELTRVLKVDRAGVAIFTEAGEHLTVIAEYDHESHASTIGSIIGVRDNPATQWVLRHRKPLAVVNAQDPAQVGSTAKLLSRVRTASILIVPMITQGEVIGTIGLDSRTARVFTENEKAFAQTIANHAATAIERAGLFDDSRRSALEQGVVSDITTALNATLDIERAFPAIVRGLRTLVDCDRVSLALLDATGETFTMAIMDEPNTQVKQLTQGTQMPVTASAASADILARREHITGDLSLEKDYPAEKILYDAGYRSRINLPLIVGDQSIGSLNLTSRRLNAFNSAQIPILQQIANAIAISIKNGELYQAELTRREELDALYNLSRKLANVTNAEIILDLVAQHSVETIHVTFVRIVTLAEQHWVPRTLQSIRAHDSALNDAEPASIAATPFAWDVLLNNQPAIIHADDARLSETERAYLFLGGVQTLCLVPLTLGERRIGLLMLGEERHAEREPFTAEKIRLAHNIADQAASALHRVELFTELENAYLQTVLALANAVDAKDSDTNVHSQRLTQLALAVGKEMGLNARDMEDLHYGALLHDIGKIGVPDAILNKPGPLSPEEWDKMHQHPAIGAQIIAPVPRLAGAAAIVRCHHERYDGKGYPNGIAGEAIPLGARILTVVDSYGAIIDKRVYKEGQSHEQAIAEIKRCAGTQFDPIIVQAFLRVIDQIERS